MRDLTGKVNAPGGAETQLTADEWNDIAWEARNMLESIGLTSDSGDLFQLLKAVSQYAAGGNFYTDGGVDGIAYVLSTIGSKVAPGSYHNGMKVRFRPNITSVGTTPTVNVATLGVKNIVNETGGAVIAGDLSVDRDTELRYDGTDFRLLHFTLPNPTAQVMPKGYVSGFVCQQDSDPNHDIITTDGVCRDEGDNIDMSFVGPMVKRLDGAWAAGNTNGGFPSSGGSGLSLSANTWYRYFAIAKADGTIDFGWDVNADASVLLNVDNAGAGGTPFLYYRQIAWHLTDNISNIIDHYMDTENPNKVQWEVYNSDTSGAVFTTASSLTVSAPPDTRALFLLDLKSSPHFSGPDSVWAVASDLRMTSVSASEGHHSASVRFYTDRFNRGGSSCDVQADSNSQVRIHCSNSHVGVYVNTFAFIYNRGRG